MNFTYTLTPGEIHRQVGQRHGSGGMRWWASRTEPYLSAIFIAIFVISQFPALTRVVAFVVLLTAAGVFSRALFARFRISIGRSNDPMEVVVTSETISTMRDSATTTQRWAALQRFTVTDDGIMVEFADGTRRWVPDRAFADPRKREAFLSFVSQHSPPSVALSPESQVAVDARPIVALTSGMWHWSIEHTDAARATLWLEDPADERNNMTAQIDDDWVDWTPERLEAAMGVPTRRDFVDADDVTWRIEFRTWNVAEANTVDRPDHLPTIPGVLWVLAEGAAREDAGLPWAGLAHASNGELREWFEAERAPTARTLSHQRFA